MLGASSRLLSAGKFSVGVDTSSSLARWAPVNVTSSAPTLFSNWCSRAMVAARSPRPAWQSKLCNQ
jgi:hypothetical protein